MKVPYFLCKFSFDIPLPTARALHPIKSINGAGNINYTSYNPQAHPAAIQLAPRQRRFWSIISIIILNTSPICQCLSFDHLQLENVKFSLLLFPILPKPGIPSILG
jgi:hypothetical protein